MDFIWSDVGTGTEGRFWHYALHGLYIPRLLSISRLVNSPHLRPLSGIAYRAHLDDP